MVCCEVLIKLRGEVDTLAAMAEEDPIIRKVLNQLWEDPRVEILSHGNWTKKRGSGGARGDREREEAIKQTIKERRIKQREKKERKREKEEEEEEEEERRV
jgi:hypothetical protein